VHVHRLCSPAFCKIKQPAVPVWSCVIDGPQRCEAVVIEAAVGDLGGFQEGPHIRICPPQYGIHSHEGRPSRAAWTEFVLTTSIGITSAQRLYNQYHQEHADTSATSTICAPMQGLCSLLSPSLASTQFCFCMSDVVHHSAVAGLDLT